MTQCVEDATEQRLFKSNNVIVLDSVVPVVGARLLKLRHALHTVMLKMRDLCWEGEAGTAACQTGKRKVIV